MSLEQAIQENTAAIHALIAKMGSTPVFATATTVVESKPAPAEKPEAKAKKQEEKKTAEAPAASTPVKSEAGPASSDGPTLKQVGDMTLDIAKKKGREAAVALLAKFDAKKAPEIKPADYPAFIEAAKAILEAEEALV